MVKPERRSRMCCPSPVKDITVDLDEVYDVIAVLHVEHSVEAGRTQNPKR